MPETRHYVRDVVHRNWNWDPRDRSYRVIVTASLLHIARCVERLTQRVDAMYHESQQKPVRKKKAPAKAKSATVRKKRVRKPKNGVNE